MSDFLLEIGSYLTYAYYEAFGWIDTKYWPTMRETVSIYTVMILSSCVGVFIVSILDWRIKKLSKANTESQRQNSSKSKSFDIAPNDEVLFESLVTQEEIEQEVAKNTLKNRKKPNLSGALNQVLGSYCWS